MTVLGPLACNEVDAGLSLTLNKCMLSEKNDLHPMHDEISNAFNTFPPRQRPPCDIDFAPDNLTQYGLDAGHIFVICPDPP